MVLDQNISLPSNMSNRGFSPLLPFWVYFRHLRILVMRGISNLPCRYSETVSKKVSWGCASLKIAWILFCPDSVGVDGDLEAQQTCPFESQFFTSGDTFSWTALRSHGKEQCVNINVEYLSLKISLGCSTNLYCVCCGFLSTACLQRLDLLVYRWLVPSHGGQTGLSSVTPILSPCHK